MKDDNDVIKDFNHYVNMTASELDKWLKTDDSKSAGWPKDNGSGDSVGRDSGRNIIQILKANPKKDPSKYTDEQIQHMRKVAAYCKRHLAQEGKKLHEKPVEEAKKSKAYISLKNWGHDPLKGTSDGQDSEEDDKKAAGSKRKAAGKQEGETKKRETEKASSSTSRESRAKARSDKKQEQNGNGNSEEANDDADEQADSHKGKSSGKAEKGPKPGQKVSWNWGQGQPTGKVLDVKPEKTTITTKRGSKVSRDGDPKDPAVVIDTGKSKAVKSNHELN